MAKLTTFTACEDVTLDQREQQTDDLHDIPSTFDTVYDDLDISVVRFESKETSKEILSWLKPAAIVA